MTKLGRQFGYDSKQSGAPDQPEKRPTQDSPQHTQRKGRIRSGDQKENGDVINNKKHALRPIPAMEIATK